MCINVYIVRTAQSVSHTVAAYSIRILFVRWRNRSSPDSFVLLGYGKRQDGTEKLRKRKPPLEPMAIRGPLRAFTTTSDPARYRSYGTVRFLSP